MSLKLKKALANLIYWPIRILYLTIVWSPVLGLAIIIGVMLWELITNHFGFVIKILYVIGGLILGFFMLCAFIWAEGVLGKNK